MRELRPTVPEVSLISSWHMPKSRDRGRLAALEIALKHRIRLHDLYFLNDSDIAWHAQAADLATQPPRSPLEFAASLNAEHIRKIGGKLAEILTQHYAGALVGPRPRFAALATYWPFISLLEEEEPETGKAGLWRKSIDAIKNSLRLARELGCKHVEIVGGSALPEHQRTRAKRMSPEHYRAERLRRLAQGLREVFAALGESREEFPALCVEIEPGAGYLINNLSLFERLREEVGNGAPSDKLLLNADVAHILLSKDPSAPDVKSKLKKFRSLADAKLVGHFHISDHSRSHGADLAPGVYHFFEQYKPWLEAAIELTRSSKSFSKCVAIELEACEDVHEAARAISRVSRWLDDLALGSAAPPSEGAASEQKAPAPDPAPIANEGIILSVDIGNSTAAFFKQGKGADGAGKLANFVSQICQEVHNHRGAVLSFTGDGIVAFFQEDHQFSKAQLASNALKAGREIEKLDFTPQSELGITLRAGYHFGKMYIPSSGHLRHQAIGEDVVIACRLCSWIGTDLEQGVPPHKRRMIVAISSQVHEHLPPNEQADYEIWGKPNFKGLASGIEVYVEKMPSPGATLNGRGQGPSAAQASR